MAEVVLTKRQPIVLTDSERQLFFRVMFGAIDGLDESSRRAWRLFWRQLFAAEPSEVFSIRTWFPRDGQFHKRHMLLEHAVYHAQERIPTFEGFRNWLKVGAGHCDWVPGPRGRMRPVPRSIAYSALDEHGMREFHAASVAFLRTAGAQKYLWPHLKPARREEMIETILAEFEE